MKLSSVVISLVSLVSLASLAACKSAPTTQNTGSAAPVAVDAAPVAPNPTTVAVDAAPPEKVCTEMDCADQFSVKYSKALTAAGKYGFDVEVDGKKRHCDAALPQKPCKADGTMNDVFTCTGADNGVDLGYQGGCSMPPADQNLGERLSVRGNPAKVKVTITFNKKTIASKEFTAPGYKEFAPNGPGCGPVCKQASDTLEIK